MKREILIFRHGQTDWNLEKRLQGHTNTDLNDLGRLQAQKLVKTLDGFVPEVIYSSDLNRAFFTAQIANKNLQAPIISTTDLRECRFGVIEGQLVSDIKEKFGVDIWERLRKRLKEDDDRALFEGAETRGESLKRFLKVIDLIFESDYKKVAISTHGGVLRTLLSEFDGDLGDNYPIPNCVSYIFDFDGTEFKGIKGPIEIDPI